MQNIKNSGKKIDMRKRISTGKQQNPAVVHFEIIPNSLFGYLFTFLKKRNPHFLEISIFSNILKYFPGGE